ncbi:MAG: DegT/DnrJ/EryC1/StrS family aminotransferase [Verrucomicrobiota bacterium]
MNVPLLDLKPQYMTIKNEVDKAVAEVIESQRFIMGPEVEKCEKAIADYSGCRYGTGVSSGTDALLISLMAEKIGPGDDVLTTAYSFFATAGCISRTGARPVFVDIDPVTYNIDPALLEKAITPNTRAVIPVHLYGQMAEMSSVMDFAEKNGLVVIEDAAQAIGSEYRGRRAGSIGHYGCFSFFPSKNLGAFGDGGMVVTNSNERSNKLRELRNHGAKAKYYHEVIGGNFRLDAIQAAVVNVKLKHLDSWTEQRQRNAEMYDRLLTESGMVGSGAVKLPARIHNRHIFNQYVIRAEKRDQLQKFLAEKNIGTSIYYPLPFHMQTCFKELGYKAGDFPESEKAAHETLALPIFPELSDSQITYVADSISSFYNA